MRDKTRGIYQKFEVIRADGSGAPGGKHENCFYFVLDCSHDPHAEAALKAYIASCRLEYPHLARDLECVLDECQFGRNTMVSSPVEPSPEPCKHGHTNQGCRECFPLKASETPQHDFRGPTVSCRCGWIGHPNALIGLTCPKCSAEFK